MNRTHVNTSHPINEEMYDMEQDDLKERADTNYLQNTFFNAPIYMNGDDLQKGLIDIHKM